MVNEPMESQPRVAVETWLSIFEREYLAEYLPAGGAAVKFVSGTDAALHNLKCGVEALASKRRMRHALLDAGKPDAAGKKPDLHRMDKFFFAAMAGMDWKGAAAAQARQSFLNRGIQIRPGRQLSDLAGIAADNDRAALELENEYRMELANQQLRDYGMAIKFRTAIATLGRMHITPNAFAPATEEVFLDWLSGRAAPGSASALKRIQIYERIHQTNARFMLASRCRWLPNVGLNGLVVTLDFRPYEYRKTSKTQRQAQENRKLNDAIARGETAEELAELQASFDKEPDIAYTEAAYMQMLALLRRFIDDTDWFERFALVILTTPAYYDALSRRNYNNYDALQTRIGLEVRDAHRPNPTATLVHLEGAE